MTQVQDIIKWLKYQEPQDILKNLPESYNEFNNHSIIISKELTGLEVPYSISQITQRCEVLDNIHKVINYYLSQKLTTHSPQIIDGIYKINMIKQDLGLIKDYAHDSSVSSAEILHSYQNNTLKLISKHKRRRQLSLVRSFIATVLQKFNQKFRQIENLISKNEIYPAYELIYKTGMAISDFLKYRDNSKFISLTSLKRHLEKLFAELNKKYLECLKDLCNHYNPYKYCDVAKVAFFKLQINKNIEDGSFSYFTKIQDEMRRIIKSTSKKIIVGLINTDSLYSNFLSLNLKFKNLIKLISQDKVLKTSNELFKLFSTLQFNNHMMTRHHENELSKIFNLQSKNNTLSQQPKNDDLEKQREFHQIMKSLLLSERKELWQIQIKKIVSFVKSITKVVIGLPIAELFEFLALINKFIVIGYDFSGLFPSDLLNTIEEYICNAYYDNFHRSQYNNIKLFVEEDLWNRMPLPDYYEVPELSGLMNDYPSNYSELLCAFDLNIRGKSNPSLANPYQNCPYGNPFDADYQLITIERKTSSKTFLNSPQISDELCDVEDEIEEKSENERIFIQNSSINLKKRISKNVIISTSGLTLTKCISKYVELLCILKPISFKVYLGITNIFELFIFIVFLLFTNQSSKDMLFDDTLLIADSQSAEKASLDSRFQVFLEQSRYELLKKNLIRIIDFLESNYGFQNESSEEFKKLGKMEKIVKKNLTSIPKLNSSIKLEDNQTFQSLPQRIVAVESLFFIYDCLKSIRYFIEGNLPNKYSEVIDHFFTVSLNMCYELRDFVYSNISFNFLKLDSIMPSILGLKWEIKEIRESPNAYCETILYNLKEFNSKLEYLGGGSIPKYVQAIFFNFVIRFAALQLSNTYAKIKRCSLNGKRQILKDVNYMKNCCAQYQTIESGRKIQSFELIQKLIETYDFNLVDLISWISENKTYPIKTLFSLLNLNSEFLALKKGEKKEKIQFLEKHFEELLLRFNN